MDWVKVSAFCCECGNEKEADRVIECDGKFIKIYKEQHEFAVTDDEFDIDFKFQRWSMESLLLAFGHEVVIELVRTDEAEQKKIAREQEVYASLQEKINKRQAEVGGDGRDSRES